MSDKYIHKKGIVYLNQYHIIFCPKYRRKVLVGDIEKDLKKILYEVAEENDIEIKALEIMPDHVHIFISFDPRQHIHSLVQKFKGKSSRILREKYPKLKSKIPSLWTRSYFCCTVGHISEETIVKYIEDQKSI
ncbi:putative transposase [Gracilibacillus halotolerans]|uniref:Putative transposase n=1 Tax=Gracilibacillus halotolerans TaxID=74386 RepID=A0A841RTB4_9BACI|nr:IS200/IS605 family transposase [Gracilibacillus halotolerans]MBB6514455.1 putative transposase [Gracilibacillus halotolerans]